MWDEEYIRTRIIAIIFVIWSIECNVLLLDDDLGSILCTLFGNDAVLRTLSSQYIMKDVIYKETTTFCSHFVSY